jgi:hypothetical protein
VDRFEWEKNQYKTEKQDEQDKEREKVEQQQKETQINLEIRKEEITLEQAQLDQQIKEKEDQKQIAINMTAEGKSASESKKFINLIYAWCRFIFLISNSLTSAIGGFISNFNLLIVCFCLLL